MESGSNLQNIVAKNSDMERIIQEKEAEVNQCKSFAMYSIEQFCFIFSSSLAYPSFFWVLGSPLSWMFPFHHRFQVLCS